MDYERRMLMAVRVACPVCAKETNGNTSELLAFAIEHSHTCWRKSNGLWSFLDYAMYGNVYQLRNTRKLFKALLRSGQN